MNNKELSNLSKEMSYLLRHKPEEYDIQLDSNGCVEISKLIDSINKKHKCQYMRRNDIDEIIKTSDKKRFEIIDDKYIRAYYGHSTDTIHIKYEESIPPTILYHGTTLDSWEKHIKTEGIKKMKRQYVHLSEDYDTACNVAARRSKDIVILYINTQRMHNDGIKFYKAKDNVWLVDYVDIKYIDLNLESYISDEPRKKYLQHLKGTHYGN